MSDQDTFKSVSVAAMRHAHQALAEKVVENDLYIEAFAELDSQLAEYEVSRPKESAIERARAKLRMKRSV